MNLSPSQVRKLLGESAFPRNYTPATPLREEQCRRRGLELKVFVSRLQRHEAFILCRFLEGYTPEQIAGFLAAHPETVRLRIRQARLFPTTGRGKPPKNSVHPLAKYYRDAYIKTSPTTRFKRREA